MLLEFVGSFGSNAFSADTPEGDSDYPLAKTGTFPVASIRSTFIASRRPSEDRYTEPPRQELDLTVIGDDAYLSVTEVDHSGKRGESTADVIVPARSLLLALQAANDDAMARAD